MRYHSTHHGVIWGKSPSLHNGLQTHNIFFNKALFDPTRYHHCSAPGNLPLSTLAGEGHDEYFAKVRFIKFTPKTLVSEKSLRENLEVIRSTDHPIHDEERLAAT